MENIDPKYPKPHIYCLLAAHKTTKLLLLLKCAQSIVVRTPSNTGRKILCYEKIFLKNQGNLPVSLLLFYANTNITTRVHTNPAQLAESKEKTLLPSPLATLHQDTPNPYTVVLQFTNFILSSILEKMATFVIAVVVCVTRRRVCKQKRNFVKCFLAN